MDMNLFDRKGKPTPQLPLKPIKDLTPMVEAADLLATGKRSILVNRLQELSGLTPDYYKTLGVSLLHHFTHYCQSLPETTNSYYSLPGGILDFALNRTEAALQLFRQFLIISDGDAPSEIQLLWLYALLSASILKDVGKLQIDYAVQLYDNKGKQSAHWNALQSPLFSSEQYYQFTFEPDHDNKTALRRRINLLLAQQIMPKEGFAWIASNPEVLASWLALLSDDWRSAGTLGAVLERANAIAIQYYFNEFMLRHVSRHHSTQPHRIGSFIDTPHDEQNISKDQVIGIEFIKWLTKALESGTLILNKGVILSVPGGLLINPDAFKLFLSSFPIYKAWQAVQQGFLSLGLHRNAANGNVISRYEQTSTGQLHEGILLEHYGIVLPHALKMQNSHTGKIATISAIELIHLAQYNHAYTSPQDDTVPNPPQHLTSTGEWKVIPLPTALKPGKIRSD